MRITCGRCKAVYSIDDKLLTSGGVKAQCPACGDIQVVRPPGQAKPATPPPLPGSKPPASSDPFADLQPSRPPAAGGAGPDPFGDPFADLHAAPGGAAPGGAGQDPFADMQPAGRPPAAAPPSRDPFADFQPPPSAPPPAPADGAGLPSLPQSVSARPGPGAAAGAPAKGGEAAQRCERCGRVIGEPKAKDGLCQRCRALVGGGQAFDDREWRVQKPDGVILGPLTLVEVKEKFRDGEVGAMDKVARRDGEFRLISSYPEFALFFKRPGAGMQPTFRPAPPSHAVRNGIIAILLLLAGAVAAVYFLWHPEPSEPVSSALEDALDQFAQDVPNPTGSSIEAVKQGRAMMLRDERTAYVEADRLFKMALLLERSNMDAIGGWVQNRALLDAGSADISKRKVGLDLIDYAIERAPNMPTLQRSKAFLLESLGRHKEARDLATKLMTLLDEDPETQLVLGMTYLDSNTDLALELFQKAQQADAQLSIAFRMMGEANIRLGRFHKALQFFDRRLEKDPGQYQSLNAMARIYMTVGQFKKARGVFETILATDPGRVQAAVELARLHSQIEGKPNGALAILDRFLKANEKLGHLDKSQVLSEKAAVLRLLGKRADALALVRQSLELDSMSVQSLYLQAVLELETGDLKKAIVHLRDLRSHLPTSARVLAWLGQAEAQVPNLEPAIRNLRMAIDIAPADLDLYLLVAMLYLDFDTANRAYTWLRKATEIDPFHIVKHRSTSAYYDGPGFLGDAARRAEDVAGRYPEEALAQTICGAVLWRAGLEEKGRNRLQAALEQDPESFAANLYLGAMHFEQEQYGQALPYLEQAHKSDALQAVATRLLARVYLRSGKVRKAEALFRSVHKVDPGDIEARLGLAEVLLARKKKKDGSQMLMKVYKGDSGHLEAKRLLFKLGY
ncbi:MAG: zinc-ribbon domain-containing protein [Deltaproteobacteria bacterium]|nr:zinc-ribbon domain-containing protein [Deltaproteobacteria bacterium]